MLQPRHADLHNLHMRVWAVLLHECFDDFPKLLGKYVQLNLINLPPATVKELEGLNSQLSKIKKKNQQGHESYPEYHYRPSRN